MHLTLHFLGETPPYKKEDLTFRLKEFAYHSFPISIGGCGHFGSGNHPSTLWAGVRPSKDLVGLHQDLSKVLKNMGFPLSVKEFKPHITLARLPRKNTPKGTGEFLVKNSLYQGPVMNVESFSLYQSEPTGHGNRYTVLERFELNGE